MIGALASKALLNRAYKCSKPLSKTNRKKGHLQGIPPERFETAIRVSR
jgi:hypothetical protein